MKTLAFASANGSALILECFCCRTLATHRWIDNRGRPAVLCGRRCEHERASSATMTNTVTDNNGSHDDDHWHGLVHGGGCIVLGRDPVTTSGSTASRG